MHIAGTTPISATNGANGQPSAKKAELEQAAKAFEAIFLRQMIGAMRSSSLAEGLFDNSASVAPGAPVPDPLPLALIRHGRLLWPAADDLAPLAATPAWARPVLEAALRAG